MSDAIGEGYGEALREQLPGELESLRGFAVRLVGRSGAGDAEDVVQEVVVRTLRYGGSFDPGRPLGPWLKRTALRVWLDLRAGGGRDVALEEEVAARHDANDGLELREEVERMLSALSGPERTVLERFHRGGQSVDEISRALGLPEGTVKSHLHRARRKIAQRGARP